MNLKPIPVGEIAILKNIIRKSFALDIKIVVGKKSMLNEIPYIIDFPDGIQFTYILNSSIQYRNKEFEGKTI